MPPSDIKNCREIDIPSGLLQKVKCFRKESTSLKGQKAIIVVREMLLSGLIPLSITPTTITDRDLQIRGIDIIIKAQAKLQVKCDYPGGRKERGGSGNLFLQVAERNPGKRY